MIYPDSLAVLGFERRRVACRFVRSQAQAVCRRCEDRHRCPLAGRQGCSKVLEEAELGIHTVGQCGTQISDLFPQIVSCADEMCVIRSMKGDHTGHYEATLGIHTGSFNFARPSIGSWVSYGLGTENQNLPSFAVIAPQTPYTGNQAWASDFLPGCHQGTHVLPGDTPIANMRRRVPALELQEMELEELALLNRQHLATRQAEIALEARIRSFETAFGMQRGDRCRRRCRSASSLTRAYA